MQKFRIRMRYTRVHEFLVDAANEEEAREIAPDLDEADSLSDQFDSYEFLDAIPIK